MPAESRGTALIWAIAAVLGAIALWRLLGAGGDPAAGEPVRVDRSPGGVAAPGSGATAAAGGATPSRAGAQLYVHVAGAVRRPGLVRVAAGSRVAAALARAGGPGPKADLTGVNLAAQVEDGQQVVVPVAGAVPGAVGPAAAGQGAAAPAGLRPSLGTATPEQLDEIDGIGPTLAERIIEYRTENGGFGSLSELQEVEGIGEKRFETLREALQP
jgi:competence protein ComEA